MAASVLDLSTFTEPTHVRIDGALYPLRHPETMSLVQVKRLERQTPRLGQLMQQDTLTTEEEEEVALLLQSTCLDVLDAPDDVQARLTDMQRVAVLDAFTQLRTMQGAQTSGARGRGSSLTGARKSRGSNGSTGAIRKAG